jgi:hypothetical protein
MDTFGFVAVKRGFVSEEQLNIAVVDQLRQHKAGDGVMDTLDKILFDKGFLTGKERDKVLEELLMEPDITWGQSTRFAKELRVQKAAKQAIGEYIGNRLAGEPSDSTVFLSNSSTLYYAFRGMLKYKADVNVLTTHAAVLSTYPSLRSRIRSVSTIWRGRVNLDIALIEPFYLEEPSVSKALGILSGDATYALISASAFDSTYGPMADNATEREVSRRALQSETHTCVLIDHTKIRVGTSKNEATLLFRAKEWREIFGSGTMEIVVSRHPGLPDKLAHFPPSGRESVKMKRIMSEQNASKELIKEVLKYQDWSMRVRDVLTEVPFKKVDVEESEKDMV